MLRKSQLFAILIFGLSIATPAMALNPQPLPPGIYAPPGGMMLRNQQSHYRQPAIPSGSAIRANSRR